MNWAEGWGSVLPRDSFGREIFSIVELSSALLPIDIIFRPIQMDFLLICIGELSDTEAMEMDSKRTAAYGYLGVSVPSVTGRLAVPSNCFVDRLSQELPPQPSYPDGWSGLCAWKARSGAYICTEG
ncbi:hypothetical protein Salat_1817300 [Sesamum alatum]|uniref:Uncharacterized protein n=1 Tax=Sesamum alatum TaxID=300844 RepID=A0AAE1Y240_9LAMI|nr:hypothetical protein Salat_1817300 [Sesamum alatum]